MRWDLAREGVAVTELGDEEFRHLYTRSERIQDFTDRIQVRSVTNRSLLPSIDLGVEHAEWVDVLHLARELELPVWSDDLGLRRLARGLGLIAFGTPSVVEAVRDSTVVSSSDTEVIEAAIRTAFDTLIELAADMVVDLPLGSEGTLQLAASERWRPGAGAVALSRPAWWAANPDGLETLLEIYSRVSEDVLENRSGWQYSAMYGVASALDPDAAAVVLAMLAMIGFGEDEPDDEERVRGLRRAREIAAVHHLPDPAGAVAAAAASLGKAGRCDEPEATAARILASLNSADLEQ